MNCEGPKFWILTLLLALKLGGCHIQMGNPGYTKWGRRASLSSLSEVSLVTLLSFSTHRFWPGGQEINGRQLPRWSGPFR